MRAMDVDWEQWRRILCRGDIDEVRAQLQKDQKVDHNLFEVVLEYHSTEPNYLQLICLITDLKSVCDREESA